MTKERIEELANYFYDKKKRPQCRISVTQGMSGFDLSRQGFAKLLDILSNSYELDSELEHFVKIYGDYE